MTARGMEKVKELLERPCPEGGMIASAAHRAIHDSQLCDAQGSFYLPEFVQQEKYFAKVRDMLNPNVNLVPTTLNFLQGAIYYCSHEFDDTPSADERRKAGDLLKKLKAGERPTVEEIQLAAALIKDKIPVLTRHAEYMEARSEILAYEKWAAGMAYEMAGNAMSAHCYPKYFHEKVPQPDGSIKWGLSTWYFPEKVILGIIERGQTLYRPKNDGNTPENEKNRKAFEKEIRELLERHYPLEKYKEQNARDYEINRSCIEGNAGIRRKYANDLRAAANILEQIAGDLGYSPNPPKAGRGR